MGILTIYDITFLFYGHTRAVSLESALSSYVFHGENFHYIHALTSGNPFYFRTAWFFYRRTRTCSLYIPAIVVHLSLAMHEEELHFLWS